MQPASGPSWRTDWIGAQFSLTEREPHDSAVAYVLPKQIFANVDDVCIESVNTAERDRGPSSVGEKLVQGLWGAAEFEVSREGLIPQPTRSSEIVRNKAGPLHDPREHSRAYLVLIVEGEHNVGPTSTRKNTMRAGLSLDGPADPTECGEDSLCASARHWLMQRRT